MKVTDSLELLYADQFSVDYYNEDYALITIKDGGRFLVIPENAAVPKKIDEDIAVLQKPLDQIYPCGYFCDGSVSGSRRYRLHYFIGYRYRRMVY